MLSIRPSIGWHPPKLHIDMSAPMGEIGLKRSQDLARDQTAVAKKKVLEGIAKIAQEGDRLRDIHLGVDIAQESAARAWPPPKEINVGLLPRTPVTITPEGGARPEAWFEAMA